MGDDPDVLAAARGYCRNIENNYVLTMPEILAKSKGLEAFLVQTNEGYYLFNEGLTEGRLIANDYDTTLARLQSPEIQFNGLPIHAATAPGVTPSNDDGKVVFDVEVSEVAEDVSMT